MTWEQAARRRNRHTWIWLVVGAAVVGAVTWTLQAFVVYVHLGLSAENARLAMTIALTCVWGGYFFGWSVRGNLVEGIDQQMASAGPYEKDRFGARVDQELGDPPARRSPEELYLQLYRRSASKT